MKIDSYISDKIICPACGHRLSSSTDRFSCNNADCAATYPVKEGIPILICPEKSIFSVKHDTKSPQTSLRRRLTALFDSILPKLDINIGTKENFTIFSGMLQKTSQKPLVLVIGGGTKGEQFDIISNNPDIVLVETDVYIGPQTMIVCDAHDIPFEKGLFDGVIIQAVLEHVLDPPRCVSEIHRVLKDGGLLYAETPFMQPVHMGAFDFTRFTHLGHRRLFRHFEEIKSGPVAGAGLALSLSAQYFLTSFFTGSASRYIASACSRILFFWLKYLDYHLVTKPGNMDAASGFYFLGRKTDNPLPDRELIKGYRGAIRMRNNVC